VTTPLSDHYVLDLFRLDGRVAIVTGASSGLGARFAAVLAAAGATVIAAARRVDRLEELALRAPIVPFGCDVSEPDGRARLVMETLERYGKVDVLVNNAGVGRVVAAEDEPLEEFAEVMDVNVTAAFALSQLVARPMLDASSGVIVNVASVLGLVAGAPIKQAAYCASKGAIISLTRELAVQWARLGVRVNALAPGWFPTEMTRDLLADEQSAAWLRRNTPMGRVGVLSELDGALLFLASDASSFCTGQALVVDGGWTAR
jgi:NAD(P)-dependent dehydrogenase (short-subunit alcohol dehydrogenase family)